ncbi:Glutamate receptor 3 [Amphibalanus amphitrite]|uniref:Glutamate receptor 3 n=1 Tax=Amphibalanus amphitrite TaxID=1232801 RepID=A0A6A4XB00_AMPAM|nr:glutamate receptor ionotropic, delta-1-like [Amphibalanus amphitrite]KAF0314638.1 Glutamate receptor 3 [Amphibalanus amphitrite]KAF0314639.1 Glutamate receptor 3 [Amphibalanus amphitrite]
MDIFIMLVIRLMLGSGDAHASSDGFIFDVRGRNQFGSNANFNEAALEKARRLLRNRTLTVATIQRPPMTILQLNKEGDIVGYKGFCFEMLKTLMQKYDFKVRLVLSYDGNWGSLLPNNTWNGMVGMVNRTEVDMAVSGFTISHIREQGIDFTAAFHEESTAILLPAPRPRSKAFALIQPFSWKVWLALCAAVVGVTPVLHLISRAGPWTPALYPDPPEARPTYSHIQWFIFGGIIGHGDRCIPASLSSRVMLAFWWSAAVTIMASYTGTLIASLTVPTVADSIESLEELAFQDEIKWTYRIYSSMDNLFRSSGSAVFRQMATRYADSKVTTDYEGVDKVLTGEWAFIKERSFLDFALDEDFQRTGQCRLQIAAREFYTVGFGWVLQTGSPLKELFDLEFLRMSEMGLFGKWRGMYWPAPSNCSTGLIFTDVGSQPLALADLVSAFLLLALGAVLSTVVLAAEMMYRSACAGRR